mgnify:FL=1
MNRITYKYKYKLNNLPPNLQILIIHNVDEPLDRLPTCLKILDIKGVYSHDLDNLPSILKILKIHDKYNGNLHDLPSSLEKLIILSYYSLEINNLPQNLSSFVFSCYYDTKINLSSCPNMKSVYIQSISCQNTLKKILESSYPKITFADMNYNSYTITDDISQILGYNYEYLPNGPLITNIVQPNIVQNNNLIDWNKEYYDSWDDYDYGYGGHYDY